MLKKCHLLLITFLLISILLSTFANAQLIREWTAPVFGTIELSDSNYIFGAQQVNTDPYRIEIYRVGFNGELMWKIPWEQTNPQHDYGLGTKVVLDPMRNLHLAGSMISWEDSAHHSMVAMYDQWGNLVFEDVYDRSGVPNKWSETYKGFGADDIGNTYLCGFQAFEFDSIDAIPRKEVFVIKYSPQGARSWISIYHPDNLFNVTTVQGVAVDQSGNTYVLGAAIIGDPHSGNYEIKRFVVTYDTDGTLVREDDIMSLIGFDAAPFNVQTVDKLQNVYFCAQQQDIYPYNLIILKYSNIGGFQWFASIPDWQCTEWSTDLCVDEEGNVIVVGNTTQLSPVLVKLSSGGNILWRCDVPGSGLVTVDIEGNIYVGRKSYHDITRVSPNGVLVWTAGTSPAIYHIEVDEENNIYVSGEWVLAKYRQNAVMIVRDAYNDTIPEIEFNLIRLHNNPPNYTEDTLGSFVTDSLGKFAFEIISKDSILFPAGPGNPYPDILLVGDTIKVAKLLYIEPAVKHQSVLGTMYSISLDNMKIDSLGGISFDTLITGTQDIILGHTEYRYNLLAVVEWDAEQVYLEGLEQSFRTMSNYLYDVTDGQFRLDTVVIFDNNDFWSETDVHIKATNMHSPNAMANGILYSGYCGTSNCAYPMTMPRKWYGSKERGPDSTYTNHPLNGTVSQHDRTIAHEFGHYGLGFYDEYLFRDVGGNVLPATARCGAVANYGFMDKQYESWGELASEMSSRYRYEEPACQNTDQYVLNGNLSCWDFIEKWAEGDKGLENIYVPILKPDLTDSTERIPVAGYDYIIGPNDNLSMLDYDVGALVHFPEISIPPVNAKSLHLSVTAVPADGANVILNKFNTGTSTFDPIDQGKTTALGLIWVLGVNPLRDKINASGHVYAVVPPPANTLARATINKQWLYGEAELSGSGFSRLGNLYRVSVTGDSVIMDLKPVFGDYPLICDLEIQADKIVYQLTYTHPFSELPSLDIQQYPSGHYNYNFTTNPPGYTADITDTLSYSGTFTVWAVDDSSNQFFFNAEYIYHIGLDQNDFEKLVGPNGGATLWLDTLNTGLEKLLIIGSPYPVIMNGFAQDAVQAGKAYSLSTYPFDSLEGINNLSINYSQSDLILTDNLIGDESVLKMYRWDENTKEWQVMDCVVDTVENYVASSISASGVYVLFTTNIITGVEEDQQGLNIPKKFDLQQNYPNPFNSATIIEYTLPSASQVEISIYNILGQKIRTLVDEVKPAGVHTVWWDGSDNNGKEVSSGVYFYQIKTAQFTHARKMLLLK